MIISTCQNPSASQALYNNCFKKDGVDPMPFSFVVKHLGIRISKWQHQALNCLSHHKTNKPSVSLYQTKEWKVRDSAPSSKFQSPGCLVLHSNLCLCSHVHCVETIPIASGRLEAWDHCSSLFWLRKWGFQCMWYPDYSDWLVGHESCRQWVVSSCDL